MSRLKEWSREWWPTATVLGAILAAVGLAVTLILSRQSSGPSDGKDSSTTTAPASVSTTTPQMASTTILPPPSLPPNTYRLDFADKTHVDLDNGVANLEGGAQFEVRLSGSRFFFTAKYDGWKDTQVKYVKDDQATRDGCVRGTRLQQEVAHLSEVEQDESICVSTSEGRWAVMKIIGGKSSGLGASEITFNVTLA